MEIKKLEAPICEGGENPMWDPATQELHYIDNTGRKVHTLETVSGATRTLEMPDVITTLVLRESGGAVVTLRSGIHFLDLGTGALEVVHPLGDTPTHVFNDGKVDARGRFMIGGCTATAANPTPDGGLFRLDPDRTLTKLDSDVTFSNSPCWSPDSKTFYFSDSWVQKTYAYDYNIETGAVSNKRVFLDTAELGATPDGATVDTDGLLWIALYKLGKIAAYRPDGKLVRMIDMPVKLVSSVAFGGPGLDRLFVTTIAHGIGGEPVEPGAGALYVIDGLGAKGRAEHRFAG